MAAWVLWRPDHVEGVMVMPFVGCVDCGASDAWVSGEMAGMNMKEHIGPS